MATELTPKPLDSHNAKALRTLLKSHGEIRTVEFLRMHKISKTSMYRALARLPLRKLTRTRLEALLSPKT